MDARGGVPVDDLLDVLEHLQLAIIRQVEVISGRQTAPGRIPDSIRSAGALVLTGTSRGSLVAEFELAEPAGGVLPDLGAEALDAVLAGIDQPQTLEFWVAREVMSIRDSLREVESVELRGGSEERVVVIRRDADIQLPSRALEADSSYRRQIVGRLLEVDWKDRTAELHDPTGIVRLAFNESQAEELRGFARKQVVVTGSVELRPDGRVRHLVMDGIEPVVDDAEFWTPRSIVEMATQQGIEPFVYPSEPAEEEEGSADEMLTAIFG